MSFNQKYIGGEFASSTSKTNIGKYFPFSDGTWTTTGSVALEHIIKELISKKKIKNLYLPIFICESIIKTVQKFNYKIHFYDLYNNFKPKELKISNNSAVIIVNFFGLNISKNFYNTKRNKVYFIHDLTHSLYDKKILIKKEDYFFCSLRKFGIFNFGGWTNLKSEKMIKKNLDKLVQLSSKLRLKKFNYLLNNNKNLSYEKILLCQFKIFEKKLYEFLNPIKKKNIKIITNMSLDKIINIRRLNYFYLKKNIPKKFQLKIKTLNKTLPVGLICNIKKQRDNIRSKLIDRGIFCPIHWKIKKRYNKKFVNSFHYSESFLTLPVDQRYNISDMKKIVKIFNEVN